MQERLTKTEKIRVYEIIESVRNEAEVLGAKPKIIQKYNKLLSKVSKL